MAALSVATTINPRFDHVTPIEATRSDVTISHRCLIFAELMAVARSGLVDIVLVADEFDLVNLESIHLMQDSDGRIPRLAAISDIHDERQRLLTLGIPVASPHLSGTELVAWLQAVADGNQDTTKNIVQEPSPSETTDFFELEKDGAAKRPRGRRAAPAATPTNASTDGPDTTQVDQDTAQDNVSGGRAGALLDSDVTLPYLPESSETSVEAAEPVQNSQLGHITAVWGPLGAPGVTTIALNLAMETALTGRRTLLIDADTYGASVAIHLGLLDDTAAIAQACRAAEHRGLDLPGLTGYVQRVTVQGSGLDVLTGLTRSDRWPQVRATAWSQVLDVARQGWDEIVIDCGFGLEEDEELSFDIPAPQRNATTVVAVTAADTVVAVGTGDPVGLGRFMRGLEQLTETTQSRVIPVINKVSAMTSGLTPKRQLKGVWERFGPKIPVQQFIDWAPEVTAAALLHGKTLAESAPKAEIRLAITRLMEACMPPVPSRDQRVAPTRSALKFLQRKQS